MRYNKNMKLKNYQEDFVLHILDIVLKDRTDIKARESFIHDAAAYALNRIPAKYIMSERGFTRLASDHWIDLENDSGLFNLVELLLLVNRAIDVVKNRRESVQRTAVEQDHKEETINTEAMLYWHNFQYLIGRVVDRSTMKPVYGTAVTLYIDGKKSKPVDSGWQNPYYTNPATKGLYSFLPKPVKLKAETKKFNLRVTFEHKEYEKYSLEKMIYTKGDFEVHTYINSDDILNLETACLRLSVDKK